MTVLQKHMHDYPVTVVQMMLQERDPGDSSTDGTASNDEVTTILMFISHTLYTALIMHSRLTSSFSLLIPSHSLSFSFPVIFFIPPFSGGDEQQEQGGRVAEGRIPAGQDMLNSQTSGHA